MDKIMLIFLLFIFFSVTASHCEANNDLTPAIEIKNKVQPKKKPKKTIDPAPRIKKEDVEYLMAHNEVRAKKKLAPLEWSTALERYSRQWAKHLATDGNCSIKHSDTPRDYGENLAQYWGGGTLKTGKDAVEIWAAEELYYDYDTNTCDENEQCGHYTQIVWSTTTQVGCATYKCTNPGKYNHSTIHVCQYYPPGNWVGKRPY